MARLFALIGYDGPDRAERRKQVRPAHLASLEDLDAARGIVHGGPLLDDAGNPIGSLILFEAADLAAAQARAASDPYVTEGVFATYRVIETRAVFGEHAQEPAR